MTKKFDRYAGKLVQRMIKKHGVTKYRGGGNSNKVELSVVKSMLKADSHTLKEDLKLKSLGEKDRWFAKTILSARRRYARNSKKRKSKKN